MFTEYNKIKKEVEDKAKGYIEDLKAIKNLEDKKIYVRNKLFEFAEKDEKISIQAIFRYPQIYNLIDESVLDVAIKIAPSGLTRKTILWKKHSMFSVNHQIAQRIH